MATERLRALAHPWWLGALVVLVVNDAYLKAAMPGIVTGKLSDAAGVIVLAWLLGTLSRRPARAAAVVSLAFGVLKLVPGVSEAVAPLLGGTTRRDPSDLIALSALLPSVSLLRRALGASAPPEPVVDVVRVALAVSAAVTAALAVGATSCQGSPGVSGMRQQGDVIWLDGVPGAPRVDGAQPTPSASFPAEHLPNREWARSDDGGRTWSWGRVPGDSAGVPDQVCERRLGCFRIAGDGTIVEHRDPGSSTWTISKRFTSAEVDRIEDAGHGCAGDGVHLDGVAIVAGPEGPEVVVAAGTQGVLHRTPDGTWHRRGVLGIQPAPIDRNPLWYGRAVAWVVVPIGVIALAAFVWVRTRSRASVRRVVALGAVGWLAMVVVDWVLRLVGDPSEVRRSVVSLGITLVLSLVLGLVVVRSRP